MQTIVTETTRTAPVYGRKAFGPGRKRTEAAQVRDIAASITRFEAEGTAWTWERYGLQANVAKQTKVLAALGRTAKMFDTHTYRREDVTGRVVIYHLPGMHHWTVCGYVETPAGEAPTQDAPHQRIERIVEDVGHEQEAEANALCWAALFGRWLGRQYGLERVA